MCVVVRPALNPEIMQLLIAAVMGLALALALSPLGISAAETSTAATAATAGAAGAASAGDETTAAAYDFIVVGAGSTGSVVAGRLALASYRVLLIEAGGPTQSGVLLGRPPVLGNFTLFDIPLDWQQICTEPKYSAQFEWKLSGDGGAPRPHLARGLGGCSIHNAMVYVRGTTDDYTAWTQSDAPAHSSGTAGSGSAWNWESVLEMFKKSEDNSEFGAPHGADHRSRRSRHSSSAGSESAALHGRGGPIRVSSVHESARDPFAEPFVSACRAFGIPSVKDFNGDSQRQSQAGFHQFLIRDGVRESPAAAFFRRIEEEHKTKGGGGDEPAIVFIDSRTDDERTISRAERERRNSARLTVRMYAHVTRVVFDSSNRASGVEWVAIEAASAKAGGVTPARNAPLSGLQISRARYEVVLSAGAIHTPKLLLLSGIGAPATLSAFGIPLRAAVDGVGQNLMDAAKTYMQFSVKLPSAHNRKRHRKHNRGTKTSAVTNASTADAEWERCSPLDESHSDACDAAAEQYLSDGTGVYGTPGFSAGAFIRSPPPDSLVTSLAAPIAAAAVGRHHKHRSKHSGSGGSGGGEQWPMTGPPNVQFTLHPWDILGRDWSQWPTAQQQRSSDSTPPAQVITLEVFNNAPQSRGGVSLTSADPLAPPDVNINYLSEEADIAVLEWAIQTAREIMSQHPIKELVVEELLPGSNLDRAALRDYVLCGPTQFRASGGAAGGARPPKQCDIQIRVVDHIAGTCRMGPFTAHSLSVVDPQTLAVHGGVSGLRVADASVMPTLPSGNTHATCVMIGEMAAHLIINHYATPTSPIANGGRRVAPAPASSVDAISSPAPANPKRLLPLPRDDSSDSDDRETKRSGDGGDDNSKKGYAVPPPAESEVEEFLWFPIRSSLLTIIAISTVVICGCVAFCTRTRLSPLYIDEEACILEENGAAGGLDAAIDSYAVDLGPEEIQYKSDPEDFEPGPTPIGAAASLTSPTEGGGFLSPTGIVGAISGTPTSVVSNTTPTAGYVVVSRVPSVPSVPSGPAAVPVPIPPRPQLSAVVMPSAGNERDPLLPRAPSSAVTGLSASAATGTGGTGSGKSRRRRIRRPATAGAAPTASGSVASRSLPPRRPSTTESAAQNTAAYNYQSSIPPPPPPAASEAMAGAAVTPNRVSFGADQTVPTAAGADDASAEVGVSPSILGLGEPETDEPESLTLPSSQS